MEGHAQIQSGFLAALIFLLAALALTAVFHAVFRRLAKSRVLASGRTQGLFPARMALPLALLAAAAVFRIGAERAYPVLENRALTALDAFFIFAAFFFLIRLGDALFLLRYARRGRPIPIPRVLHGFTLIVLYLAALFTILRGFLNIDITPFLATSALLTAIIGLALQGVLGNILAGLSLHMTRSFDRGDWVKIGDSEGVVMDTNWRETRILDRASNVVVIPNNLAASQVIVNFSLPDKPSAVHLPVQVGFEAPPAVVVDLLKRAARETKGVASSPSPVAFILSYNEWGVSYNLKFWLMDYARKFTVTGDVARLVWHKFRRNGIAIPVPLSGKIEGILGALSPAASLRERNEETVRAFEDLSRSAFLRRREGEKAGAMVLSPDEIRMLAEKTTRKIFAAGEILFRQGERGETCYLLVSGRIRGEIATEEDGKPMVTVFRAEAGEIIGEMSLLSGLPRTATVIVEEESELLEIAAEAFVELLGRNPGLKEDIASLVADRNRENLDHLRKLRDISALDIEAGADRKSVLDHLKKLVHLFRKTGD